MKWERNENTLNFTQNTNCLFVCLFFEACSYLYLGVGRSVFTSHWRDDRMSCTNFDYLCMLGERGKVLGNDAFQLT